MKRWAIVLVAVGALGALAWLQSGIPPTTATVTAAPQGQASAPRTLLDIRGSGIKTTETFGVGPQWDMYWMYDCTAFGSKGNFIVDVFDASGRLSPNAGTDQLGMTGSDVEHFHHAGTYYLEINSECGWHVSVQGYPRH